MISKTSRLILITDDPRKVLSYPLRHSVFVQNEMKWSVIELTDRRLGTYYALKWILQFYSTLVTFLSFTLPFLSLFFFLFLLSPFVTFSSQSSLTLFYPFILLLSLYAYTLTRSTFLFTTPIFPSSLLH